MVENEKGVVGSEKWVLESEKSEIGIEMGVGTEKWVGSKKGIENERGGRK